MRGVSGALGSSTFSPYALLYPPRNKNSGHWAKRFTQAIHYTT